ncbi:MAG: CHAT domain-containing protein [Roseivirga sp.]|nr:CHAT domain-containing protein [Roseivirga sp.]
MTSNGQTTDHIPGAIQVQILWEKDLKLPQTQTGFLPEAHSSTSSSESLLKPLIQLIATVKELEGLADVGEVTMLIRKIQLDINWLKASGRSVESDISAYVLHYRLACLKQEYFRLKLTYANRGSSYQRDQKAIELVELIATYLERFYQSGLVNASRKNQLTKKYQLIEQALLLLNMQNESGRRNNLMAKLLWISNLGEFELNRAVIGEKGPYKWLIRNLLQEIEPLETEMNIVPHDNHRYHTIFQKRNQLRTKYFKLIQTRPVALSQKSELVNDDITRIDFFEGENHLFQYVNRRGQTQLILHRRGDYEQKLSSLISRFHSAPDYLTGNADLLKKLRKELNQLYNLFFARLNFPLSHMLIIKTDGLSNALPFESLVDNNQDFLISSHTIRYDASLRDTETVLDIDSRVTWLSGAFESEELQLPAGKLEFDVISDRFTEYNQAYKLSDIGMNEGLAVVITHQIIDSQGLPALLLSETDTVSMVDFYQVHNLPMAMVINACASLAGLNISGEGRQSIGRRAMELGTNQLLANLWEVEDRSAATINAGYLKALHRGELSSVGLGQSKRDFLSGADEFYQHPYFWSPLVHHGNDIRLKRSGSPWRYVFFLLPCLLLLKFRFRFTFV